MAERVFTPLQPSESEIGRKQNAQRSAPGEHRMMRDHRNSYPKSLRARLRQWRNDKIASPAFRRAVERFPLTRWFANRQANRLFKMTAGFVFTQTLHGLVKTGALAMLESGMQTSAALAQRTGLTPDRSRLLMRCAANLDLVVEIEADQWMLADLGVVVAADKGIQAMILHHHMLYADIAEPDVLLADPDPDTQTRHYWAYVDDAAALDEANAGSQQRSAPYSKLMAHSQSMLADCILDAYDFKGHAKLVDVGGGNGAFLAAAGKRHAHLKLGLFDLRSVAEQAQPLLAASELGNRVEIHGGDFCTDRIPGDADIISLVRICCDHDDEKVLQLLKNLHRSMQPGSQLLIAEAMAGSSEGQKLAATYFNFYFLAMGSGRCRSADEIGALLQQAGFKRIANRRTANPLLASLITAAR